MFSKYFENIPLILHNYKKLKRTKTIIFTMWYSCKCWILLSDNRRIIFKKAKKFQLNIRFLSKFWYRTLPTIFDSSIFKFLQMRIYITYVECMQNYCTGASGSWSLSCRRNISFVNIVFEISRKCPPNIGLLQKAQAQENKSCDI